MLLWAALAEAVQVGNHEPISDVSLNETGEQDHATLAVNDAGVALVAWHADSASTPLGAHPVFGSLYDARTGAFLLSPFLLDFATQEEQWLPDVGVDPSTGRFVVAWSAETQPTEFNAYFRIVDEQGNPVLPASFADRLQINQSPSLKKIYPDVAVYENGDFVVAWEEVRDGQMNYFLRLITVDPYSLGEVCAVNAVPASTPPTPSYGLPDVAIHPSGLAAVAWENVTATSVSVKLSIVDPRDCTVRAETDVDVGSGSQRRPAVDMDAGGLAVVAWTEVEAATNKNSVFMKSFRMSQGALVGGSRVNISGKPPGSHRLPVVMLRGGGVAVAWSGSDIYLRLFDDDLNPVTEPLVVNAEASDFEQTRPAFAALDVSASPSKPEFLVPISWESRDSTGALFIQMKVLSITP